MILASVAKLNIHRGDPVFDRAMEEINAAQEEGVQFFNIDAHRLDTEICMDIVVALTDLGYVVEYVPDEELIEVVIE